MKMNKKTILIIIVVVVIVVAVAAIVVLGGHHGEPAQTTENGSGQNQPTQQAPALYTSSADGFSVGLPGTPTIASKTVKSPTAGTISETDYTFVSSAAGKGILYMIVVFHYPATYQFSSNYLTGALQMFTAVINGKYPGTTVAAQPQSQFLGGPAISGSVTVPFMGTPTAGNVLITTKNHNSYVVSAYGLSQNDYNAFLNSFTFTQ